MYQISSEWPECKDVLVILQWLACTVHMQCCYLLFIGGRQVAMMMMEVIEKEIQMMRFCVEEVALCQDNLIAKLVAIN